MTVVNQSGSPVPSSARLEHAFAPIGAVVGVLAVFLFLYWRLSLGDRGVDVSRFCPIGSQ
jgi:hypothetical protein